MALIDSLAKLAPLTRGSRWLAGASVVMAATSSAPLLTPGHAYCFYWAKGSLNGGMHLVAQSPTSLAAGPSNYISGIGGKPQDTVVYVSCQSNGRAAASYAYVGLPHIALKIRGGYYRFSETEVVRGVRHLESSNRATFTVRLSIQGTVVRQAINGTFRLAAPGCLAKPISMAFHGT